MADTRIWGWLQPASLPGFSLSNQDNLGPGLNGTVITTAGYTEYALRDLDGDGIVYDTDTDDGSSPTAGEGIVYNGTLSHVHELAVYENSTITVNGVDHTVRLVVSLAESGTWSVRILDEDIQPGWYPADITAARLGTFYNMEYSGTNISSVDRMLCFGAETPIMTTAGWRRAGNLRAGDQVMTAGGRFRPLTWTARMHGPARTPDSAPIMLDAGVLGLTVPIRLSPQHRILIASPKANLLFGTSRVLVAARCLLGMDGVSSAPVERITYVHLKTARHTVLRAPGLWCETFLAGTWAQDGMPTHAQRSLALASPGRADRAAYRSLNATEATLLLSEMGLRPDQRNARAKASLRAPRVSVPSPAQDRSDAPARTPATDP